MTTKQYLNVFYKHLSALFYYNMAMYAKTNHHQKQILKKKITFAL